MWRLSIWFVNLAVVSVLTDMARPPVVSSAIDVANTVIVSKCITVTMPTNWGVAEKIIDLVINGSGVRDTGRVLKISPTTVIAHLKNSTHPK